MKMIYFGRNETDEEFDRSCFMLTLIHPAGMGVVYALAGRWLFGQDLWFDIAGGLVLGTIVAILSRRNVAEFRRLRRLYQMGVLK
jgi:hypothetical protein